MFTVDLDLRSGTSRLAGGVFAHHGQVRAWVDHDGNWWTNEPTFEPDLPLFASLVRAHPHTPRFMPDAEARWAVTALEMFPHSEIVHREPPARERLVGGKAY